MYDFIYGKVMEVNPFSVIIDNSFGFGIEVNTTPFVTKDLRIADGIKLFVKFIVKEDSQSFYGFNSKKDRNLFCDLISVSGVGCKTALTLMSVKSNDEIIHSIRIGDEKGLVCKGIGGKTVSKLVLDLKDKFKNKTVEVGEAINNENLEIAIKALQSLGFKKPEIDRVKIEILVNDDTNTIVRKYLSVL